ncbi:hypothetical protein NDI76_03535 [Halogeometricum sp. S1BR25-6]|uniref:Uncharacterized protein n=1 Tax=Halogeometricum salsisoli TaxID=2950536 RepID=A0ABU2GC91_9EURY|nr:hypothetical protein [Halogeometricum sp. S1BR25-6]MDS0297804.1 hypothetical protein [Halogeometricum sp. S1BR25-6]
MTNDARRTRGDAWAWALLSLFGPPSADDGTDGENGDGASGRERSRR